MSEAYNDYCEIIELLVEASKSNINPNKALEDIRIVLRRDNIKNTLEKNESLKEKTKDLILGLVAEPSKDLEEHEVWEEKTQRVFKDVCDLVGLKTKRVQNE